MGVDGRVPLSGHFTPRKTRGTLCTEDCVGSRDSLDVWGICCPYRDSVPQQVTHES